MWYDGTQHPWEFKRVWHFEPSLADPDTVYAGVEDAAMFRSTDGGKSWHELAGLRGHGTGPQWQPGAGGMGLHTILYRSARIHKRIFIAISAAGTFRTDDGGKTWKPINRGLRSQYIPDPDAEIGHCVHRIALHPSRPDVLFMQKHWDVMRSDDAGENWHEVSGDLPTDFGFPIEVHAHEPETVYVVPITSDSLHYPPEGKLRVYRSRTGGNDWEPLTNGLPQENCYVNVLRDAMCVDSLDPCGVYFGTTGGQVYGSADGGDSWTRDCPRPAGGAFSRGAGFEVMIRVVIPYHLKMLAQSQRRSGTRCRRARHVEGGPRRARSPLPDAVRHDSRPDDGRTPAIHAVLRLRAGLFERAGEHALARSNCIRRGASAGRRCYRGRLGRRRATMPTTASAASTAAPGSGMTLPPVKHTTVPGPGKANDRRIAPVVRSIS